LFGERDFRVFFTGYATSLVGSAMAPIAITFALLDRGASPARRSRPRSGRRRSRSTCRRSTWPGWLHRVLKAEDTWVGRSGRLMYQPDRLVRARLGRARRGQPAGDLAGGPGGWGRTPRNQQRRG